MNIDRYNLNSELPSMDNIYSSTAWEKTKNNQLKQFKNLEKKKNYSPNYGLDNNYHIYNNYTNETDINSLSGNKIKKNEFYHNNMQHYISKPTQNIKITENFSNQNNKKELPCFFKPVQNINNDINGNKNNNDYTKERINLSNIQNNTFPIEKKYVAPGINSGYNTDGIGGFQQFDSREFSLPKNIDELRSKNNQKEKNYNIPFKASRKDIDKRGIVASYSKNKPETVYNADEKNWFITNGSILKNSLRSFENIKATNQHDTLTSYTGGIKYDNHMSSSDDYGKENILVNDNERSLTEANTNVANLTSIVKSIVSPVLDALKYTNKQYTINSARESGNIKGITEKATLYDPSNKTKTTIKETTIHDNDTINLTGPNQTYTASHDNAKTTIKETIIHDNEYINLTGPNETYTASHDSAKTTIKETMLHDNDNANLKGENKTYIKTYDDMRTTIKETIPIQENTRNIGNTNYRIFVYDPEHVAKTTVKETVLKSDYGFLGGVLNKLMGGYINKVINFKNTNKQFTSDYEDYGIAGSVNDYRQSSRKSYYNAEIDDTREKLLIAASHTPNPGNMNLNIDKKDINLTTNKNINDSLSSRSEGNIGRIYQNGPSIKKCNILNNDNEYNNAYDERLDSSIMNSLKANELNIEINPIISCN